MKDDVRMFGCHMDDFSQSVEESLTFKFSGPGAVVVSLMSDAQEEIYRGMYDEARQTLNRAKWLMDKYGLDSKKTD